MMPQFKFDKRTTNVGDAMDFLHKAQTPEDAADAVAQIVAVAGLGADADGGTTEAFRRKRLGVAFLKDIVVSRIIGRMEKDEAKRLMALYQPVFNNNMGAIIGVQHTTLDAKAETK